MKNIFLLLVVLIPSICFSQSLPVKLNIHSEPIGDHSYILLINLTVKDGWQVYAEPDTSLGIDPLTIVLGNNNLELSEDESDCKPTHLVDSLFGNKLFSVYTHKNIFHRIIKVPERSKFMVVSMAGFASNQRKVEAIEICRVVDLDNGFVQ